MMGGRHDGKLVVETFVNRAYGPLLLIGATGSDC